MNYRSLKDLAKLVVHYNKLDFLPIRKNVKGYNKQTFQADFGAGVNVALLAFPQGMAYALIAGLPIEYGIYGSAIAAIFSTFFAGNRFITLGPTNATSVMLGSSFAAIGIMSSVDRAALMPVLLLMIGVLLILGAYFRVANLIHFISKTVVTGYITAAAFLIIANQMKNMIGVKFDPEDEVSSFFEIIMTTFNHLPEFRVDVFLISLGTFLLFYFLDKKFKKLPNVAITLLVMSGLSVFLQKTLGNGFMDQEFLWLKSIDASEWHITMPALDFDLIGQLSNGALAIALLCVLEGTSIGSSLAARSGSRLEANQEMFCIGASNIGCGFFSGMPASGSLTRSVLSWTSGSKTPIASLINGILCVIGAFLLGPFINFIPKSVLAVLVVMIGISLINKDAIRICLKATRGDGFVFILTMCVALLVRLDTAIYFGMVVSIILFLKKAGAPELVEYGFTEKGQLTELETKERPEKEVSIVHVEGNLFFGATEVFRVQIRRVCEDPNLKIVILKMRNAHYLDATGVMAMEELVKYMNERDRFLLVSECRKEHIRIFKDSGLLDVLNRKNVFPDSSQNPTISTAEALKRAQEIIGDEADTKISIFVNPNKPTS